MDGLIEVPTLPCASCGAPLPVDDTQAEVTCPRCGARAPVPGQLRAAAHDHRERVRRAWGEELWARRLAGIEANAARANTAVLRWIGPFALSVPFWLVGGLVAPALPVPATALLVGLSVLSFVRVADGMLLLVTAPDVARVLASGLGACSACGAPVPIAEGDTSVRCRHCGATGQTPDELRRQLASAAFARVGPALSAQERAAAENWRTATDAAATFGVGRGRSVVGPMVAVLMLGACALTGLIVYALVTPDAPRHDVGWLMLALPLGATGAAVRFVRGFRRVRRERDDFVRRVGPPPPR